MEKEEKKVRTQRWNRWLKQSFRLSKECLVSILYLSHHVSKYGKRDDDNSVIV